MVQLFGFLKYNRIFLLQEIAQLANLTILDLTKNRLSNLPTRLDHMTSLKDLLVSENFLESVPSSLGQMANLYQLKLDMNRLFQLPDCFERLVDVILTAALSYCVICL